MECRNHPSLPAVDRCAGCMESFCANCLVMVRGRKYCSSCKVMAFGSRPMVFEQATEPCKEAGEALKYAIIGLFCFGIILEPIAILKAVQARRLINANPNLTGSGKATAALIIGFVGLALWVLGIVARARHV